MPRGIADEKLWKRAERIVAPHAHRYEEPYAVVMTVYKSLLAAKKKPKKKACKNPHSCACAACKKKRRPKKPRA